MERRRKLSRFSDDRYEHTRNVNLSSKRIQKFRNIQSKCVKINTNQVEDAVGKKGANAICNGIKRNKTYRKKISKK